MTPILIEDNILCSATVEINVYAVRNESEQYILGVILHEFGHLFGLRDCEELTDPTELGNASIMSYQSNFDEISEPQDFDIRNVCFNYG